MALGASIEQLIAESTGKDGRGILPVDGEPELGGERRTFTTLAAFLEPAAFARGRGYVALHAYLAPTPRSTPRLRDCASASRPDAAPP